jgi:hypothetical protein
MIEKQLNSANPGPTSGGPEGKATSTRLTGFTGLKNISFEESRSQCPVDLKAKPLRQD